MGHRFKNMQSAWDNIPPVVNDAVASSTHVDKAPSTIKLIDDKLAEKLASSIQNTKALNKRKEDLIKRGKLTSELNDITSDVELQKKLINRQ